MTEHEVEGVKLLLGGSAGIMDGLDGDLPQGDQGSLLIVNASSLVFIEIRPLAPEIQ